MGTPLYSRYMPIKKQVSGVTSKNKPTTGSSKGSNLLTRVDSVEASHVASSPDTGLEQIGILRDDFEENCIINSTVATSVTAKRPYALAASDLVSSIKSSSRLAGKSSFDIEDAPRHSKKRRTDNGRLAEAESSKTVKRQSRDKHSSLMTKFENSVQRDYPGLETSLRRASESVKSEPQSEPRSVALAPFSIPQGTKPNSSLDIIFTVPKWVSNPIRVPGSHESAFETFQIQPERLERLRANGLERTLPIQAGALPLLLPTKTQHPGDVCISAATGSGKTLAYAIPVVDDLSIRRSHGLRALIVVPTRELVKQVREVFDHLASGTSLRVGEASGSRNLEQEQAALIKQSSIAEPAVWHRIARERSELRELIHEIDGKLGTSNGVSRGNEEIQTGQLTTCHVSKIDILVATPGRLVEHIKGTQGFSLQHLEWLVIDEADRLLDSNFQEWTHLVNEAVAAKHATNRSSLVSSMLDFGWKRAIRKVVLSATMTTDLQKLADLSLQNPRLLVVENSGKDSTSSKQAKDAIIIPVLPNTLSEYGIPVGDGSHKPLQLVKLLDDILDGAGRLDASSTLKSGGNHPSNQQSKVGRQKSPVSGKCTPEKGSKASNVLIFTTSNESAHRLAHLLRHLRPVWSCFQSTLTKSSSSSSTIKTISRFQSGSIRLLVATERASRGLDLPTLDNVVNYDVPHNTVSYIHRVGRAARAGRDGRAWTLVEDKQARWFWKEIAKGKGIARGTKSVTRIRVDTDQLNHYDRQAYSEALSALERDVRGSRVI